jgi:hypothetical protein
MNKLFGVKLNKAVITHGENVQDWEGSGRIVGLRQGIFSGFAWMD